VGQETGGSRQVSCHHGTTLAGSVQLPWGKQWRLLRGRRHTPTLSSHPGAAFGEWVGAGTPAALSRLPGHGTAAAGAAAMVSPPSKQTLSSRTCALGTILNSILPGCDRQGTPRKKKTLFLLQNFRCNNAARARGGRHGSGRKVGKRS